MNNSKENPTMLIKTYDWDDITDYGDGKIYINDEYYGTDEEFYDDIDSGKIEMINLSEPDPEEIFYAANTTWLERHAEFEPDDEDSY